MSGQSTYVPKSGIEKWLDSRLPAVRLFYDSFIDFPVPRNLNYWWAFGSILTVMLAVMILTGVILAMHYTANTELAFGSVQHIMRDVNYGWLMRYMHANGASMFFLAVYIHIFRGMYYGSYKAPREVLWILGVLIFLLMMATAFLGYTLPWGQMSFWGATVITSLFSAIPVVGTAIQDWLLGGFSVDNAALNRFFSLHYLLPFVIAGVVVLHVWALHVPGNNNPLGISVKGPQDTLPFHPYFTTKDFFAICIFLIFYLGFVFYVPEFFGNPDNNIPANPLVTPAHIVPEWYLLPFYAILRSIPDKLLGVIAMFSSIVVLFFLPWIDTSKVRSGRFRPAFRLFYILLVLDCVLLMYVGSKPPEGMLLLYGRVATGYYFFYFLVILPFLGIIERPRKLPDSIAASVLPKGEAGKLAQPV